VRAGNSNIMLFRMDKAGNRHRVSLREREKEFRHITGHNTATAGLSPHAKQPAALKPRASSKDSSFNDALVDAYRDMLTREATPTRRTKAS
jgi:hypothetical protein